MVVECISHLLKLSLADTIAVENDPMWFETCALVELNKHLSYH